MKNKALIITITILILALFIGIYLYTTREKEPTTNNTPTTIQDSEDQEPKTEELTYTDITPQEAYELINNTENLVIIDVSPAYDNGHIPNSLNYYVGDGTLENTIENLNKNLPYLIYCHIDSASVLGSEILVENGFEMVYRLEGNFAAWEEGGYPIEIPLEAVNGYEGTAVATRSYMNGQFIHTVTADIEDPASGKFYEGWLVTLPDFFSTGKMEKIDGQYILEYTTEEDVREYTSVVITEETLSQGLDNNPETHVLEGEF